MKSSSPGAALSLPAWGCHRAKSFAEQSQGWGAGLSPRASKLTCRAQKCLGFLRSRVWAQRVRTALLKRQPLEVHGDPCSAPPSPLSPEDSAGCACVGTMSWRGKGSRG